MQTRIRYLTYTVLFIFSLSVWVSPVGAKKAEAPKKWGLSMGLRVCRDSLQNRARFDI